MTNNQNLNNAVTATTTVIWLSFKH